MNTVARKTDRQLRGIGALRLECAGERANFAVHHNPEHSANVLMEKKNEVPKERDRDAKEPRSTQGGDYESARADQSPPAPAGTVSSGAVSDAAPTPDLSILQGRLVAIFKSHRTAVFASLLRKGATTAEADDLIHDIYLQIVNRSADLPPIGDLEAYVWQSVSVAVAGLRRTQAIHDKSLIVDSELVTERADYPGGYPSDPVLVGQEVISEVIAALSDLTPLQYRILVRSKGQGMSAREIAAAMGVNRRKVERVLADLNARIAAALDRSSHGRTGK
jgi:RNA polymerase sigma factor (sigma-70 family)